MSRAAYDIFVGAGARCRKPSGAFYLYPDLEPFRPGLPDEVAGSGAAFAEHLLDRHRIGVLAGEAFGDDPHALRFRVATSLLYGETVGQRWAALQSADPLAVPWIDDALNQLTEGLAGLRKETHR